MNIAHRLDSSERTEDVTINENVSFEGLLLSQYTLDGLKMCGFQKPSPIQMRAIPLGKCGFDLIVEAKSGTGKTAVFGIIALEMINLDIGCQVLVLAPTREIASQIAQVLTAIGCKFQGLRVEIVIGGTDLKDDVKRLKGNKFQILVGSPGRMKHLIQANVFSTDSIRLIVVDEADKLAEDSFAKDINYIFSKLPHRKQVIAVSATYTLQIKDFLSNFMRSASHVRPNSSNVLLGVSQYISVVVLHHNAVRQKMIIFDELLRLISRTPFKQCLVFTNHQIVVKNLCKSLAENGWPARSLSGIQSQSERLDSLQALQSFSCRILVATDLVARGIDAANVDLVVNYDPPYDLQTYLHRIGRAGRYGSKGIAVTVLPAGKDVEKFQCLIKEIGAPLVDIKHNEQLNLINSTEKDSNAPHLTKFLSEICHSAVDISNEKEIGTPTFDIKRHEQLNLINSIEKDSNAPHLTKFLSEMRHSAADISNKKIAIESFDDILMSCDQFNAENSHDNLDTIDNLIDSLDECLSTNNPNEVKATHIDYKLSNFLSPKNDTLLELDISQTPNKNENEPNKPNEKNDFSKCENFLQDIRKRCTVNRNRKPTKCFEKGIIQQTKANVKLSSEEKDVNLYKTVVSDCLQPNPVMKNHTCPRINNDRSYGKVVTNRQKQTPRNDINHFSIEDYNNMKVQLSFITQQIQSSVYINTLLELNH